ncbi:Peroxisomal membrane protein-like protein [Venustampulla echinocandica]|uniref:Peroxisomal membrane protein-like protein n=1 Tax=Venustampulla echinocandica TaxID=2656787 RepID=A0A370TS70_9HELO|nr:Peroxisomal membrane protein-like protein [Venustampulla echinocandica]RDL38377.1 Peroxisomal membrane protein-like protein [Venustampulla echinocandica]
MSGIEVAKASQKALEKIILNPKYADYLAVLKAARNGAVYGAKVRFPHALVMIFLFRSGTVQEKLRLIFKATRTHAQNLAKYATVYKMTMLLLKHIGSQPGKEGDFDTFFAGLLGGYIVFGRRSKRGHISSVSKQIVVFVFARVCLSLAELSVKPGVGLIKSPELSKRISRDAWPAFAALSWGSIMWLFRWHPDTVQSGLKNSMEYIYVQSDHWDSLRNFLIYNK